MISPRGIKVALLLTAIDKASAVIKQANKNAKAAFEVGKKAAITGAVMAAPLIYATEKAIAFEDTMADVAKVYNTKIGDSAFLQLGEQAKDLSVYLSKSAEESASLMAALGQGGVEQSNLNKVAKTAGQMAVAFDLTADIAGDRYTKLKNALGSSWDETAKLGDAINYLSDNQASKASEILEYMAAGGAGVAKMAKASGQDIAAMGSYLLSVGKSGAESATIVERFYKGIMKSSTARKVFQNAGEGAAGLMAVLKQGAAIKDPSKQFQYFSKFGEYGGEIRAMALNMGQLQKSISSVADETAYVGSVEKEFANRNSTTQGKLKKGWAEFSRVVLDFGANGLPVITDLLKTLVPIVRTVGEFMRNNQGLSKTIFMVIAGGAALSAVISAGAFVMGGYFKIVSLITTGLKWLRAGQLAYQTAMVAGSTVTGGFRAAMVALNLTLLMNPIFLIVAGVVALIAGLVIAYQKCEKFRAIIAGVMAVGKLLMDLFIGIGKTIIAAFTFNPKLMTEGIMQAANATKSIMNGGIQKSFNKAYDESMAASKAAKANKSTAGEGGLMSTLSGGPMSAAAPSQPVASKPAINFAPVINLSGSATKADGQKLTGQIKQEFERLMKEYEAKNKRLAY